MTHVSVCLIVRDEETNLRDCLGSVAGFADEIVVVDTGSVDGTVRIAEESGAVVGFHPWAGDFAAARNAALDLAGGEWILSLDADERLLGDPSEFRRFLSGDPSTQGLTVEFDDHDARSGAYRFRAPRLFRRSGTRWRGRIHERPVLEGDDVTTQPLDPQVLVVRHLGYRDLETVRRKADRNLHLAQDAVREAAGAPDRDDGELAALLLHVGRSGLSAGELQTAVDALEAVRELVPVGVVRRQATDFLARVCIVGGEYETAVHLARELGSEPSGESWAHWLCGQALGLSGRGAAALAALDRVTDLRDPGGCRYDPALLRSFRDLCRQLVAAS